MREQLSQLGAGTLETTQVESENRGILSGILRKIGQAHTAIRNKISGALKGAMIFTALSSPVACVDTDSNQKDEENPQTLEQKEEIRLEGYSFYNNGVDAEFQGVSNPLEVEYYLNGDFGGNATIFDGRLSLQFDSSSVQEVIIRIPDGDIVATLSNTPEDLFSEASTLQGQ